MPLFERLPTGLRLTAAGEIMMAAGGRWQKGLSEVRGADRRPARAEARPCRDCGDRRAGQGHDPCGNPVAPSRYPGISIDVKVAGSDQVRRMIARRRG